MNKEELIKKIEEKELLLTRTVNISHQLTGQVNLLREMLKDLDSKKAESDTPKE